MDELILVVTGVVVGVMNAIVGGGMLLGFPVMVALGIPPITANATGNIITAPGQLASAYGYRKYLRKIPLKYALLAIPVFLGASAGAWTLRNTSSENFAQLIPLLVLFGVGLFVFQPLLHFHLHSHLKGRSKKILPLLFIGLAMLPVAFYGGYFGAGLGFLTLAFLGFTSLHDAHVMSVMRNLMAIIVGITSMFWLLDAGLIDWRSGGFMAFGSVVGGYGGSLFAQKLSTHVLRIAVVVIGLCAVAYLGLQQY